jgi:monofunctional biosynthetic peptidoglycan transglycosylase
MKYSVSRHRWLRRVVVAAIVLLLAPYVITLLYAFVPPVSTPMLWRWATFQRVERTYVPIERISPSLILSVIIAEDGRFCGHYGIDLTEIQNALEDGENLSDVRGASTITQQLAKNLFLWQGHSFVRKALELPLAVWIDLVLTKKRILELYLNVAKSAQSLSRYQAAIMAAALPNPVARNAHSPGPGLRRLAGLYVSRSARSPEADDCVRPRKR